jgi:endothelin-converting enzyme
MCYQLMLTMQGVDALFSLEIEGDIGVDPNFMTLWFDQASLGLPSKEYYDEESILDVYQDVVERLLYTLSEEEEKLQRQPTPTLVDNTNVWPSWPWPPWDSPDDDEDKPNRTETAHKLAKQVIKFETRLANASLDA